MLLVLIWTKIQGQKLKYLYPRHNLVNINFTFRWLVCIIIEQLKIMLNIQIAHGKNAREDHIFSSVTIKCQGQGS